MATRVQCGHRGKRGKWRAIAERCPRDNAKKSEQTVTELAHHTPRDRIHPSAQNAHHRACAAPDLDQTCEIQLVLYPRGARLARDHNVSKALMSYMSLVTTSC